MATSSFYEYYSIFKLNEQNSLYMMHEMIQSENSSYLQIYFYSIYMHIIERCDTGNARTQKVRVGHFQFPTQQQAHTRAFREEVELLTSMKRRTFEHPEVPPVQITISLLRTLKSAT